MSDDDHLYPPLGSEAAGQRLGTARRTTLEQARDHYNAGGTITMLHDGADEEPVYGATIRHSKARGNAPWTELEHMLRTWDHGYPDSQCYIVEYDEQHTDSR